MFINYSKNQVSEDYKCDQCHKMGIKLWREYQTFQPQLLCAKCAAEDQNKNINSMNSGGFYHTTRFGWSEQIGWYIPAVPDEEEFGFWGYTSVPDEGINWWRNLPNS